MVVIQCPHCNLKVDLANAGPGRFACPHCGKEFQWGEMDEDTDDGLFAWLDRAASTMYLQIGILVVLYPVTLFIPDLLGLFSALLFVPFISYAYRRRRRQWKESMALAKDLTAEFAPREDDDGDP
jgi:DNA-directed RNA polymerase subunit RPC12/RpoP